ncbi:MAG: sodium-translocating pyrophosphatase, partial [Synergistales bacterium]|nr:sodium-translocating pyrophosphatase [Synergistales bacterium]
FRDPNIITGFGFGASSIALFARVGGGIYTKAADVGADLVGKVEAGIPEDDPRNPATIADNVGDNVGDIAGMGADLFESYVNSIIAAMAIGLVAFGSRGVLFPLMLAAIGIVSSIIGTYFVKVKDGGDAQIALRIGTFVTGGIMILGSFLVTKAMFESIGLFWGVLSGVLVGVLIGFVTEIYTSSSYKSVQQIAAATETGYATTILAGVAVGMKSTVIPVLLICAATLIGFKFAGLYGIACAAVGMLSITGMTLSVDAYGPIADNAGGIAEMSHLPPEVRKITDRLDAVGNTTAAMGKGLAIGSAALTALALFAAYAQAVQLDAIDLKDPTVMVGLFIGGMLPFFFSALTIQAVGRAAQAMIDEVRRQFRQIPGIMEGTGRPEYEKCVDISTGSALKEMVIPGLLAVISPIAVGYLLGPSALGGLLGGSIVTGVMLAIFMSNSGGAWDNAKKYIEEGHHGGKGSENHAAAVVGDTVGDPFKDTSGPSLNILIKLMSVVAVVLAPLFI